MINSETPLIELSQVSKSYSQDLEILKNIDLKISAQESVCIVGPSGAGKSTLLHILGTLDTPTKGDVVIAGKKVSAMNDESLAAFRNHEMGFVFQFHHLLNEFTALENVLIPARLKGLTHREAEEKAKQYLERVGLYHRISHYPNQLSGGELQRVAIARALVNGPKILFADEPTGNLDSQNSEFIQNMFFQLKELFGLTLIMVTHDAQFARKFSKTIRIVDGACLN